MILRYLVLLLPLLPISLFILVPELSVLFVFISIFAFISSIICLPFVPGLLYLCSYPLCLGRLFCLRFPWLAPFVSTSAMFGLSALSRSSVYGLLNLRLLFIPYLLCLYPLWLVCYLCFLYSVCIYICYTYIGLCAASSSFISAMLKFISDFSSLLCQHYWFVFWFLCCKS